MDLSELYSLAEEEPQPVTKPRKRRDPLESSPTGYGGRYGSVADAKRFDDLFAIAEEAPKEEAPKPKAYGLGQRALDVAKGLGSASLQLAGKAFEGIASPVTMGLRALEGETPGRPEYETFEQFTERQFKPDVKPLGEFDFPEDRNKAAEHNIGEFFGVIGHPANLVPFSAADVAASKWVGTLGRAGAKGAQSATKAAQEAAALLERAKTAGPGFVTGNAKAIEDAQQLLGKRLHYGSQPAREAEGVGKALLDPRKPSAGTLADADAAHAERVGADARAREVARQQAMANPDDLMAVRSARKATQGNIVRGANEVLEQGRQEKAADLTEMLAAEGGPDVMPITAESLRGADRKAAVAELADEKRLEALVEQAAAKQDFTPATQRPPEGVAAPPVAPSGAGKTIDDLFEPTPAPKGEPQQFDLGDFAPEEGLPQVSGVDEMLGPLTPASQGFDLGPTKGGVQSQLYEGKTGLNKMPPAYDAKARQEAIGTAVEKGYITADEASTLRAGKATREGKGFGREDITEMVTEKGEVVGKLHTWRVEGGERVSEFVPTPKRAGAAEAEASFRSDPRYFKTAGQAATTPAGKPTTGPVKGKAEIAREAAQKAKVHMRTQYPGELPKGKLGEYRRNPQMIVQQFAGDPRTTAHEIGHHLDNVLLTGTKAPRLGQAPEFQQHAAYLDKLGSGDRAEGWADAVEMFVRDPDQLDPAFKAWMLRELRAKNPATLDMLDTLQRGEKGLRNATPGQLIQADIDEANRIAAGEVPVRSNLNPVDKVLTKVVDEQIPAVRMTEDLAPKVKVNGKEVADPELDLGLKMRAHRAIGNEWHRYMEMGPRPGVPGLRQILENAGDTQKFDQYMAAKADEAMPLGTAWDEARNRTLQNSKALIAEVEGNAAYKDLVQARKDLIAWRKEVLKAARDSGLMDANEFAKQVKDVERGMPMGEVVGGTTTLANEAEAGFKTLIRASENEVGKTMLDLAKRDGAGKWVEILKGTPTDEIVENVTKQGRKVVNVVVDGKETSIAIDQDVYHALKGIQIKQRDGFVKYLVEASRLLRRGSTQHLGFAPVMSGKAMIGSIFLSRAQANPLSAAMNFLTGAKHRILKTDLYRQALEDRALMSGMEALTSKDYQRKLKDINNRGWWMQTKRALSKTIGPKISGAFEDFSRLGEYDAMMTNLRRNNPHLSDKAIRSLAADAGRNVDVDLMTRGASDAVQSFAAITPFWNPMMQGWKTEIAAATGAIRNRDVTKIAARSATLLGAVGLAWASSKDDKRIRAMDPQERARYLHISLGEDNPLLKIPVPPGMYGVLMGSGTLLLDFIMKNDPDAGKEIAEQWANQAWNFIPAVNNPVLQAFATLLGKDYRSPTDIRDLEPANLRKLEPGQRSRESTSEIAKFFGGLAPKYVSPIKVDKTVNTFFGSAGREVMGAADWLAPDSNKRQKPWYDSVPIIKQYIDSGETQYPRFENALKKQVRELEEVEATWKKLTGEEKEAYRLEHQDDLRSLKRLEPTMKRLDKLRERAKNIEANRIMDPDEKKRELRKLYLDIINPAAREALVRSGQ